MSICTFNQHLFQARHSMNARHIANASTLTVTYEKGRHYLNKKLLGLYEMKLYWSSYMNVFNKPQALCIFAALIYSFTPVLP